MVPSNWGKMKPKKFIWSYLMFWQPSNICHSNSRETVIKKKREKVMSPWGKMWVSVLQKDCSLFPICLSVIDNLRSYNEKRTKIKTRNTRQKWIMATHLRLTLMELKSTIFLMKALKRVWFEYCSQYRLSLLNISKDFMNLFLSRNINLPDIQKLVVSCQ